MTSPPGRCKMQRPGSRTGLSLWFGEAIREGGEVPDDPAPGFKKNRRNLTAPAAEMKNIKL